MSENLIHFYQTGTYTVGNRLLSPEGQRCGLQRDGLFGSLLDALS